MPIELGGPVFADCSDPEAWANAAQRAGYTAVYCPLESSADEAACSAFVSAARRAELTVAEVGAWSNPISPDDTVRSVAIARCEASLALADRVGALCCVNISGARGGQWDGPYEGNFTADTFALIVDTVREIIDTVEPQHADYALETMPWAPPYSVDNYLALIAAVDRERFAVHFDPVNLVSSPQIYFDNATLIRDFVDRLGPYIRSCHAKDVTLGGRLTVHLDECLPGTGRLDYPTLLTCLAALPQRVPVMLEHLATEEQYTQAAAFVRGEAERLGLVKR